MERPHVVVYNEVSIDGKVVGFETDPSRYYRLGFRWRSDVILMGSTTALAFGPPEPEADQQRTLPPPQRLPVVAGFESLVTEPRPLLVVPDSRGAVRNWVHALTQPWYRSVVVLVTSSTPRDYLRYLERRGIEHLEADHPTTGRVDLASALDRLAGSHGVRAVRTDGGGALTRRAAGGGPRRRDRDPARPGRLERPGRPAAGHAAPPGSTRRHTPAARRRRALRRRGAPAALRDDVRALEAQVVPYAVSPPSGLEGGLTAYDVGDGAQSVLMKLRSIDTKVMMSAPKMASQKKCSTLKARSNLPASHDVS